MGILILIIYLGIMGFLFYIFQKNEYDIKRTIRYIKVNYLKCCIKGEKELEKKLGVEKVKELKGELIDIDDCKEPLDTLPLDLCLSSELEREEILMREKVFKRLKEKDNFIIDGGKSKMILPLEATIFLTKSLNPLVSEEGNILIISEHTKISNSTEFEEIKMYLKENEVTNEKGELIYKDNSSILELIKNNINKEALARNNNEENNFIIKEKKKINSSIKNNDPFGDIDAQIAEAERDEDPFADIDAQIAEAEKEDKLDEIEIKEEQSINIDKTPFEDQGSPFDDDDEDIDFSKLDEEISNSMSELEFEEDEVEEVKDENKRETFYSKREIIRIPSLTNFTKETILDKLPLVFENNEIKEAILNNLLKTKPLIFSANKEVIFIDIKNLFYALSKVYGLDAIKKMDLFEKLDIKTMKNVQSIITDAFSDEISDIITNNKNVNKVILERDSDYYYSFGIFLVTDAFKKVLNDEDFDFFRHYPYNTEYKISNNENKTNAKLIPSIKDVEI